MNTTLKGILATTLLLAATATPVANADEPGCQSGLFLYGLRMTNRIICDDPIQADGSWTRHRGFFADSYIKTNCYRYSCNTYVVPELKIIDHYRVTPETILHDEPGHIPGAITGVT